MRAVGVVADRDDRPDVKVADLGGVQTLRRELGLGAVNELNVTFDSHVEAHYAQLAFRPLDLLIGDHTLALKAIGQQLMVQ